MSGLDPLTTTSINTGDYISQQPSGFRRFCSKLNCFRSRPVQRDPDGVPNNNMILELTDNANNSLYYPILNSGYVEFGDIRFEEDEVQQKVGTFAGVFCPVVLSMFSALVFVRMGFIIGNAGLLITLLQFAISYIIVIFTVCSVCAISTNGAVEGGGVYFMISRSLGPEFGGAIGTLFFFANIVSSALCFSACTEGIMENFGPSGYLVGPDAWKLPGDNWEILYGSLLAGTALAISLAGAKYFARASLAIWFIVTFVLGMVLVSFLIPGEKQVSIPDSNKLTNDTFANYTGLSYETLVENLKPNYGKDYKSDGMIVDFATVFGVLFSGVTGVMAGANMSGELQNPSRSIPRGTIAALIFTGFTYVALTLFTAASCSKFLLQNNYVYMLPINVAPVTVAIGIITATFSAGLSNMIGASRVLNALVKDNLFGSWLKWCNAKAVCVLIAWMGTQIVLLAGSLTAIAHANCALFLLSYLAVNLACLALELAGAPNFRPTFTAFSWLTALLGLIGALAMMFVAASAVAGLALILCLCLVIALHLASPAAAAQPWGSISQALIFHQVRKYLLLLDVRKDHVKYWRPQMLLLVGEARSSPPLACFVNHLKKGGLLVLGHVRRGCRTPSNPDPLLHANTPWLHFIDHLKIKAFVELCLSGTVREGARHLAQISGLGAMKPNTIMLGFYDNTPQQNFFTKVDSPYINAELESSFPEPDRAMSGPSEYVALLSDILAMDKNLCLCRHFQNLDLSSVEKNRELKYIDIWLSDLMWPSSGDLFSVAALFTLQLSCILNTQSSWKRLKLRIMLTNTDSEPPSQRASSFYLNQGNGQSPSIDDLNGRESSPSEFEREVAVAKLANSSKPTHIKLIELLKLLRIKASIHKVGEWESVEQLRWTDENSRESNRNSFRYNLPEAYVKGVNQMIKSNSSDGTALVFMHLPVPPEPNDNNMELLQDQFATDNVRRNPDGLIDLQDYERKLAEECPERIQYLNILKGFTDELPPTILVHGLKAVTSTLL